MTDLENEIFDMDSPNFNSELYIQKLLKDYSLKQIMDVETEVIRDTAGLHSEMQTLVYENYNKFISATETVKKMKTDFKKMETEMKLLSDNMNSITSFSEKISDTLKNSRNQISKLSSVHELLERLQFLFKLPNKLKSHVQDEEYVKATEDYLHAQKVLQQYGHMPSFEGIKNDCELIIDELKVQLKSQMKKPDATSHELSQSLDLLLKLNESPDELCNQYILHCNEQLTKELFDLQQSQYDDLIEFVDNASNCFLSNLCLVVQSYNDVFLNRPYSSYSDELDTIASSKLQKFVVENMEKYFNLVETKFEKDQDTNDTIILVRALDRFHRRVQAMNKLIQGVDFSKNGIDVVIRASRRQCRGHLQSLKSHFTDCLTRLRQTLATLKLSASQDNETSNNLSELLNSILVSTVEKLRGVLQDLVVFLQSDLTFGVNTTFQRVFCVDLVHEGLVVSFFHHLTITARSFCENQLAPSPLLLILSKLCVELQQTYIRQVLSQTDEWFKISLMPDADFISNENEMCVSMKEAAQKLLDHYVRTQGLCISQMLRKSVETRDWLHTIEPRTVRAVMKRVVEDIAAIDTQVGTLYEEGQRSERSSDSSRRTGAYSMSTLSRHQTPYRSNWSSFAPGQSSFVTNINKLFIERVEIFSSVEFSKVSILTGIIQISLKTLMECVRLRTFSRYGLQQIQVDTHYLQLYLWRFVSNENLVHLLLDEILGSAVHRCLDPILMEPSVVDIICERG